MADLAQCRVIETAQPERSEKVLQTTDIADRLRDRRPVKIRPQRYAVNADAVRQVLDVPGHHCKRGVRIQAPIRAYIADREKFTPTSPSESRIVSS